MTTKKKSEKVPVSRLIVPVGTPLPAKFNGRGFKLATAVKPNQAKAAEEMVYERKNVKDAVAYDIPEQTLVYAKPGKKTKKQLFFIKKVKQMQSHKPKPHKAKTGRVRQHRAHGGVTRRK